MKLTLGQALAYLKAEQAIDEECHWQELTTVENDYLQSLRRKLQIRSETSQPQDVLEALPTGCCQVEASYLANNEDFFLISFLGQPPLEGTSDGCVWLSRHLNDCYRCFEEACQVMRDYRRQLQQLPQTA